MSKIINERIEALMSSNRFSKAAISEQLGIGYSTLWRRLNGERNVNLDFLSKLAEVLGTTVSYLIGETDNPERVKVENVSNPISSEKPHIEPPKVSTMSYAYWGGVVDEARRVVERGDMREISSVEPLLKLAYDIISAGCDNYCQNSIPINTSKPVVAQMPIFGGSNNKNNMTIGAAVP